jgi:hypothetical protein
VEEGRRSLGAEVTTPCRSATRKITVNMETEGEGRGRECRTTPRLSHPPQAMQAKVKQCDGRVYEACAWKNLTADENLVNVPFSRVRGWVTIEGTHSRIEEIECGGSILCVTGTEEICEENITTYSVVGVDQLCLQKRADFYRNGQEPCGGDSVESFAKDVDISLLISQQRESDLIRRSGIMWVTRSFGKGMQVGMTFICEDKTYRVDRITGLGLCDQLPQALVTEVHCG